MGALTLESKDGWKEPQNIMAVLRRPGLCHVHLGGLFKHFGPLEGTALIFSIHGYYEPYKGQALFWAPRMGGSTGAKANKHDSNEYMSKNPCPPGAVVWAGGDII